MLDRGLVILSVCLPVIPSFCLSVRPSRLAQFRLWGASTCLLCLGYAIDCRLAISEGSQQALRTVPLT